MSIRRLVTVLSAITLISYGAGFLIAGTDGFRVHIPTKEIDEKVEHAIVGVNRIEVEGEAGDLIVSFAETDAVSAHITGSIRTKAENVTALRVSKEGDVLKIRQDYTSLDHGMFFTSFGATRVDVVIPSSYAGELSLTTVSGDMTLEAASGKLVKDLKIHTVSGRTRIQDITFPIEADTTSGDIHLSANTLKGKIKIDTVSGDVDLALPHDALFSYTFTTVSGSFDNEFTVPGVKADRGRYEGGTDVSNLVQVHTTSGDLDIVKK